MNVPIDPRFSIFTEPSHICFITSLLLFVKFKTAPKLIFLSYFVFALAFVISTKSLVCIASLCLTVFVLTGPLKKVFVVIPAVFLFIGFVVLGSELGEDLEYRREFLNLTGAVYISGWERAYLAATETNLLGLGVNQFGVFGSTGHYFGIAESLAGEAVAKFDGTFMFAKIFAEFGLFGAFFTAFAVSLV